MFVVGLVVVAVLILLVAGLSEMTVTHEAPPLARSSSAAEPGGWARYTNAPWDEHGAPVVFVYGSLACPYCAASNWPVFYALEQFGSVNGSSFARSSSSDVFNRTAGVDLATATMQSPYVAPEFYLGTDPNRITTPALPPTPQAYVATYDDGGAIPFLSIGGIFVHGGASLIDPGALIAPGNGTPYPPGDVSAQLNASSGPCFSVIAPVAWTIEALILYANGGHGPGAVTSDPHVAAILAQLR